jgi:hypothetical protein
MKQQQQTQPEAQGPTQITFRYTPETEIAIEVIKKMTGEATNNKAINRAISAYPADQERINTLEKQVEALLKEINNFRRVHFNYVCALKAMEDWSSSEATDNIQEELHRKASRW